MGKGSQRQSNIELLRILTMCGVVVLHYNNVEMGGGFAAAKGLNLWVLYFLQSFFACAVNLFVLITGYFMCKSQRRSFAKPMELLIQVVLFKEVFYLFGEVIEGSVPSPVTMAHLLLPNNYFVVLYIALYFLSPMLNLAIDRAAEKNMFNKVMTVLFVMFSVYTTVLDVLQDIYGKELTGVSPVGAYGSQAGYTIVNFALMYMIGAYIRNTERKPAVSCLSRILRVGGGTAVLVLWKILADRIGIGTRSIWEYCNPVIIFLAVEMFLIFQDISIETNRVINGLAQGAFTVFLVHGYFLKYIGVERAVAGNWIFMLTHIFGSVVVIYLISWLAYRGYETMMRPLYRILYKRVPALSADLFHGI